MEISRNMSNHSLCGCVRNRNPYWGPTRASVLEAGWQLGGGGRGGDGPRRLVCYANIGPMCPNGSRLWPLSIQQNQISWIRRRDWHILSSGAQMYTNDERFAILHTPGSNTWTLQIKFVQRRDHGMYECQVRFKLSSICLSYPHFVMIWYADSLDDSIAYVASREFVHIPSMLPEGERMDWSMIMLIISVNLTLFTKWW